MTKRTLIIAALFVPLAIHAQSALQQLESMAGQSIHDVYVPPVSDPVCVDCPDEEENVQPVDEERQKMLSDHLCPECGGTNGRHEQGCTVGFSYEMLYKHMAEGASAWTIRIYEDNIIQLKKNAMQSESKTSSGSTKLKDITPQTEGCMEEYEKTQYSRYQASLTKIPHIWQAPLFSSIGENKTVYDTPKPIQVNNEWGKLDTFGLMKIKEYDILLSAGPKPKARIMGKRLPNGRIQWVGLRYNDISGAYEKCYGLYGDDIRNIRLEGEGAFIIAEMQNGKQNVFDAAGNMLAIGSGDFLSIQLLPFRDENGRYAEAVKEDGKHVLISSNPYRNEIAEGDELEYHNSALITRYHDKDYGKGFCRLLAFNGYAYDHEQKGISSNLYSYTNRFESIQAFKYNGTYFILKPLGEKYYIIVEDGFKPFGKKYKSIEQAHKAWQKKH